MNIDERIEALRVNIESLHSNINELWESSQRHDAAIEKLIEAQTELTKKVADHEDTWNRLANIVIRHEERLDALDGGGE